MWGMCRQALSPNPENCSMDDLNAAIKAAPSKHSIQRLQAMKALLLGAKHSFVCELFLITSQTLLVWTKAFNAQGIDGLTDKPHKIAENVAQFSRELEKALEITRP